MSRRNAERPLAERELPRVLNGQNAALQLVLDPQLRVVAVSDAYAAAMGLDREDTLGKSVFELFSRGSDAESSTVSALRESFDNVLRSRVKDALTALQYGVRITPARVTNTPVLANDGSVAFIVHAVETRSIFGGSAPDESRDSASETHIRRAVSAAEVEASRARRDGRRAAALHTLADVGGALLRDDPMSGLAGVTDALAAYVAELSAIFVIENDGSLRRIAASCLDPDDEWIAEQLLPSRVDGGHEHPIFQVLRGGHDRRPSLVPFRTDAYEGIKRADVTGALRSSSAVALVPLLVGDECIGVLCVASLTRELDAVDLRLAAEVGRRCAFIIGNARLHERSQRAIRTRDEVLRVVAHDLRNPLNTLQLHMRLLRRAEEPKGGDLVSIDVMDRALVRLNRIVQDLLDVTRFEERGSVVDARSVPVRQLVEDVVAAHGLQAASRSLELKLAVDGDLPPVHADAARLMQVFENLVGNALKFTPSGSVTVGAKLGRARDVLFSVADTGCGIDGDDVPRIFDRFFQGSRAEDDGVGLGLAIVRQIVEAHGGRIWVESRLGVGSTFFFTVPLARDTERTRGDDDDGSSRR